MQNILGNLNPNVVMILARILAFATAIPFHEAAHAFVSDKLGDPTARNLGRLTLNPIKHLDPWGLLAMLVIGIGWAKPVPVNPQYYKNRRLGMAITSVAGPVSNLLLAYINMLVCKLMYYAAGAALTSVPVWVDVVLTIFYYLSMININLAVFNMLPIPPFDGSRVFGLIFPEKLYFKVMKYERFIMFGVLALLWLGVFNTPLHWLNGWAMTGMDWATGYVDGIFNHLIASSATAAAM